MKLLRLATIYFEPIPEKWRSWKLGTGEATVETMGSWEVGSKLRLLVHATIGLAHEPDLTPEQGIIVPSEPRKELEISIESAANLIAVLESCKRSISSPSPYVAFLPEDDKSREWLHRTKGIIYNMQSIPFIQSRIKPDEKVLAILKDRMDGVALLSEALSHTHATGRFHEFLRLFERAFKLGPYKLIIPLARFLLGARNQGFTKTEIEAWLCKLRHPATHADRRLDFVLESDIRPVIHRMEQAAYDVLINKLNWRNPDTERMNLWEPQGGTSSATSPNLFVVQNSTPQISFQCLDEFMSYPMDLEAVIEHPPEDWFVKQFRENKSVDPKARI